MIGRILLLGLLAFPLSAGASAPDCRGVTSISAKPLDPRILSAISKRTGLSLRDAFEAVLSKDREAALRVTRYGTIRAQDARSRSQEIIRQRIEKDCKAFETGRRECDRIIGQTIEAHLGLSEPPRASESRGAIWLLLYRALVAYDLDVRAEVLDGELGAAETGCPRSDPRACQARVAQAMRFGDLLDLLKRAAWLGAAGQGGQADCIITSLRAAEGVLFPAL